MPTDVYIQPMKDLLAEVNSANGFDLELHPVWSPIIIDARTTDIGYKIHSASTDPWRIMSILVSPLTFDRQPDGTVGLNPSTKDRIIQELCSFWGGQRTERHVCIEVH